MGGLIAKKQYLPDNLLIENTLNIFFISDLNTTQEFFYVDRQRIIFFSSGNRNSDQSDAFS